MKKAGLGSLAVISGLFILSIFAMSFASAAIPEDVNKVITTVVSVLEPIFKYILGDTGLSPEMFFAKIVFFILLFSVIWTVLSTAGIFGERGGLVWLITLGVSILGTRFLSADLISTIILPYSAVGVAITALLPFIVFLLFVEKGVESKFMRRGMWIFFAVVFFTLWAIRYTELGPYAWIYPITAVLGLAMAFFDGTIHKFWTTVQIEKAKSEMNYIQYSRLKEDYDETHQAWLTAGKEGNSNSEKMMKDKMDRLVKLMAKLRE